MLGVPFGDVAVMMMHTRPSLSAGVIDTSDFHGRTSDFLFEEEKRDGEESFSGTIWYDTISYVE